MVHVQYGDCSVFLGGSHYGGTKEMNKRMNIPAIEDRLHCLNRNIAKIRPDIREIVREELTSVIEEALSKAVKELRKPKPYMEVGYRG